MCIAAQYAALGGQRSAALLTMLCLAACGGGDRLMVSYGAERDRIREIVGSAAECRENEAQTRMDCGREAGGIYVAVGHGSSFESGRLQVDAAPVSADADTLFERIAGVYGLGAGETAQCRDGAPVEVQREGYTIQCRLSSFGPPLVSVIQAAGSN